MELWPGDNVDRVGKSMHIPVTHRYATILLKMQYS